MAVTCDIGRKYDREESYCEQYQAILCRITDYALSQRKRIQTEIDQTDSRFFQTRTDWKPFYRIQNAAIIGILEGMTYGELSDETMELLYSTIDKMHIPTHRSALPVHFATALEMAKSNR